MALLLLLLATLTLNPQPNLVSDQGTPLQISPGVSISTYPGVSFGEHFTVYGWENESDEGVIGVKFSYDLN
jgi:hypothetical protein